MSRYIDADILKANCDIMVGSTTTGRRDYVMFHEIDSAPSIDIVRCKDCKHCHYEQEDDIYHCGKLFHRFYNADEHYCSYGERKEND